ncbi:(2Fe-2S)-binding protein [Rhizobium tubonense]|uniref:(2Fe-2S)-binding protein n=1 Tax=Rhizobium tubonense TaxID=484088 RepID=A0A2W4C3E7_9HYPH|nr:(2Fe-2S)-binding protein [Rhizobium tubonense]PZM08017.1 (2Fe-2S)-binding protein [Rhizobium tubonense]
MTTSLNINGVNRTVDADADTPLLYILRDNLELNGAKYGCGLGQCGACTVIIDGTAVFSCLTPLGAVGDRHVRTIEGLGTEESPNAVQKAFQDEQAAQCGYCIAGMIMRAQSLLDVNSAPTDEEIRFHMQPNLCRCGTHARILRAIRRASDAIIANRPLAGVE